MTGRTIMECQRCGKCCERVFISLDNKPVDKDREQFALFLSYHGVGVYNRNGKIAVELPLPCKHLGEKANGERLCKIYDKRPVFCRENWCKDRTDEMVLKLAKEDKCTALT